MAEAARGGGVRSPRLAADGPTRPALAGRALARAGLVVTVGFLASRILGWARLAVFGAQFGGASPDLDAFLAAFRIPDTLFQLVAAGAIASALVPVVTELLGQGEEERAWRVVSTIANLALAVLLPLGALLVLLAPLLMPLITPTYSSLREAQVVELTRVMMASPVFLTLGAIAGALLNTLGVFGVPTLAPIAYNVVIIAAALLLAPTMGVTGLAGGVVLGAAAHLGVQLPPLLGHRFRYRPVIDLRDAAARRILLLLAPRALGQGATQIVFLVNTMFATNLGTGPLTIYTFAFTVLLIPVGILGVPLGVVLLPALSQAVVAGENGRFASLVDRSLRQLFFLVAPVTGVMIVLGRPIVDVLFGHGSFDAHAVDVTADILAVFLVGLGGHVLVAILAPAFYAFQDTWTPVLAALAAVVVDVAAAVALIGPLGLAGLALAIGLGAWVEALLLFALLRRRVSGMELLGLGRSILVFAAGAAVASFAAVGVARGTEALLGRHLTTLASLLELALGGSAAAVAYACWSVIFRVEELGQWTELGRDLLRRGRGRAG